MKCPFLFSSKEANFELGEIGRTVDPGLETQAGMQGAFSIIILNDYFMGTPFEEQIAYAERWRRSMAHDYQYMDLGGRCDLPFGVGFLAKCARMNGNIVFWCICVYVYVCSICSVCN